MRMCWFNFGVKFKWKLCVAVDTVVANQVVAMLFVSAIESPYQNRYHTLSNRDADDLIAVENHPLSMLCDIDRVAVMFDRSYEILLMAVPMWVANVECGLEIVLP